jgi:hypothetical protein
MRDSIEYDWYVFLPPLPEVVNISDYYTPRGAKIMEHRIGEPNVEIALFDWEETPEFLQSLCDRHNEALQRLYTDMVNDYLPIMKGEEV